MNKQHDTDQLVDLQEPLLSSSQTAQQEQQSQAEEDRSALTEDDDPLLDTMLHQETAATTTVPWNNPDQLLAMVANFSTSYNVVNISLVLPILEQLIEPTDNNNNQDVIALVASSLLGGMMVGQLLGGILGDVLGHSRALTWVLSLQIFASLGSAIGTGRTNSSQPTIRLYWELVLWRAVLGIGAGGVYPLAAVLSSEQPSSSSNNSSSLHNVVLTFSTQGVGFLFVPLLALPLLYLTTNLQIVWRLLLGAGSLPGILLLLRYKQAHHHHHAALPTETIQEQLQDSVVTSSDEENDSILDSVPEVSHSVFERRRQSFVEAGVEEPEYSYWDSLKMEPNKGVKLLGTALTWFLFDVLFYGNTIFQPIVLEAAFSRSDETGLQLLRNTSWESLFLNLLALPGYFFAAYCLGRAHKLLYCGVSQTPRFVMLQGFGWMAVLYFVIGSLWKVLRHYPTLLVLLYGFTFFFANYGPNTTTFVLPSLVFSKPCRSTFNGICAASGKLGALVGASLFAPAADAFGDSAVMLVCSFIAVCALIITKLFVPRSLDDHQESTVENESAPVPRETAELT